MSVPQRVLTTADEYLKGEQYSDVRHEYVDGQIFAMVGATKAHNLISANILSIVREHIRGSGCQAYIADVKVKVEATNSFYYPDVMVVCEPFNAQSVFTTSPVLIFEVLSPSTADIDRREKRIAYQQLKSLRAYVIVYQDQRLVEVYQKDAHERWILGGMGSGNELVIDNMPKDQLRIPIDAIYEGINYPDAQARKSTT